MRYKDTFARKGSALYSALQAGDKKLAEKTYKETSARYAAQYSKEDREWFAAMSK